MGPLIFLVVIFIVVAFIATFRDRGKEIDRQKKKISEYQKEETERREKDLELRRREARLKEEKEKVAEKEKYYNTKIATLDKLIEEKSTCHSHMAAIMADFLTVHYEESAKYLETKTHPAHAQARSVRELREETQEILKSKKELEYTLASIATGNTTAYDLQKQEALSEENKQLHDEIVQAKAENKRLCDKVAQEKAQNKQLTDKVGRLKSENDNLLFKMASQSQLQSEIENRFGKFNDLSNVRERLCDEIDCIKVEIEKLFSKKLFLIHQQNEAEDNFEEIEKLLEKGDFLREEIERIKSENDSLCSELRYWNGEAERVNKVAAQNLPKAFIGEDLFQQYMKSMSTTRLERALSEEMQFKPFELLASVESLSSGETYTTTLTACTCEDFKRRALPCKHMIALAIRVKALSPYQKEMEELLCATGENLAKASEKEKSAKEIRRKNRETKAELNEIKKFIDEKQQSYPWLAKLISSYKLAKMDMRVKDPYTKRELTAKIKQAEREKVLLANQLAVYEYMFPILNSFKELPPESLTANLSKAKDTGFHYNWLSEEEYKILTSSEKQQLWIKNYFSRRSKNAWEAGIKYERYIGYLCEKEGCAVKYTGALLKLNDMGRDLVAVKENTIYIIQCKRFSEQKEIHENHLFQLFGSTCHYQAEHPRKNVVGVFVTTSHLSDVARSCAEKLGILLFENTEFKEYPIIKCNIGKEGEKIYHLPFDQQYDNVTIKTEQGEMYVSTIKEAERNGFRHAMKHKFTA